MSEFVSVRKSAAYLGTAHYTDTCTNQTAPTCNSMILFSSVRARSAAPLRTAALCAAAAPPAAPVAAAVSGWLVELCVCVSIISCVHVCVAGRTLCVYTLSYV